VRKCKTSLGWSVGVYLQAKTEITGGNSFYLGGKGAGKTGEMVFFFEHKKNPKIFF